jgi:hypothetical protein
MILASGMLLCGLGLLVRCIAAPQERHNLFPFQDCGLENAVSPSMPMATLASRLSSPTATAIIVANSGVASAISGMQSP